MAYLTRSRFPLLCAASGITLEAVVGHQPVLMPTSVASTKRISSTSDSTYLSVGVETHSFD